MFFVRPGLLTLCGIILGALFPQNAAAQIPTNQDCLGAIPICGPIYETASSTFGEGNYLAEDPPSTCLIPGEYNSLWFIFTVISSGDLAFTTYPVNPGADYDWALYNLTNATCEEILTNSSLSVSCNSSQYGVTGISSTGIGNWNGPGPTNAFNYLYPVVAGETYVLNMNNWSGSTGGYTLDFSASTATIFDSVKPQIDTISDLQCSSTSITFSFSEKVLCSSVDDADFLVTGPWGPYSLSNVEGAACTVGGTQEITFTADISPAIQHGGTYYFHITDAAGGVEDLCANTTVPDSFAFVVDGVVANIDSIIQPFCAGNNGEIYASGSGGSLPYTWELNGSPASSGIFTGLDDTTCLITITDAGGCFDTVQATLVASTGDVKGKVESFTDALCFNSCDATILVSASNGVEPYSYAWSNGGSTTGLSNLCIGDYEVIITDFAGCQDTLSVTIQQPPQFQFTIDSLKNITCHDYWDGLIDISVSGGSPNYFYNWLPYGGNMPVADDLNANTYTVQVIDANGCLYDTTITLTQPDALEIIYPGDTVICEGTAASLHVPVTGGTEPYFVNWENGSTSNPFPFEPLSDSSMLVFATDSNGCVSPAKEYYVSVLRPLFVNLGADTTLCNGDLLYKNVYATGARYRWEDYSSYFDRNITERGTYWVTVYNECFSVSDTIEVDVDDCKTCVHLPDVFTPNGDGLNDWFQPIIGCTFTSYVLKVYNRWGHPVFVSDNPTDGWDGLVAGKQAELGTYVWVLDYSGSQHSIALDQMLKGTVILLR
jgi:gliding motility-associated-like protein